MDWFLWNLPSPLSLHRFVSAQIDADVTLKAFLSTSCTSLPLPQKPNPTTCHPPQSTNTWPRLRGPSLTRGYPVTRYAKSLWIPDTSASAGLRGDFQCSQTTVGLAGHFALTLSQWEGAWPGAGRSSSNAG